MLVDLTQHQISDIIVALEKQIDRMVQCGTEAGDLKARKLGHTRKYLMKFKRIPRLANGMRDSSRTI